MAASVRPDSDAPRAAASAPARDTLARQGYYLALRRGEVIKRDWLSIASEGTSVVVRSTHTRFENGVLEKTAELICDSEWSPLRLRLDFPSDASMVFLFGRGEVTARSGPSRQPEATYRVVARHETPPALPVFPLMHGILYLPMIATRRLAALGPGLLRFGTVPSGRCWAERQDQAGAVSMRLEVGTASDELFLQMDPAGHLLAYRSATQKLDVHFVERSNEC
jgi:hypothetical protein